MSRPRIDPVIWQPPPIPARARLGRGERAMPPARLWSVPGTGPEDVAVDAAGSVYTGLADGRLIRLSGGGGQPDVIADTGGRPLGIEVAGDGALVVCDGVRGLLRVEPTTGQMDVLLAAGEPAGGSAGRPTGEPAGGLTGEPVGGSAGGEPLRVCNNAAVATDGTVYFSDSSQRFGLEHWRADLLEHSGTGRLLRRDPAGGVEVLLDGLHFANGVALSPDESFVVVAETGAYRLRRLWLTGERAGAVDLLMDNLPGFPDNVSTGTDGLIWIALGSPRNPLLDRLSARHPAWRRAVWALPEFLQPGPANTAWVQAVDGDGRIVYDLQATVPGFSMVTGVRERHGTVWLGSLLGGAVAAFDRPHQT